jgi:hypothetical protein
MAITNTRYPGRRFLFARIGWMQFYGGPVPGDERPVGGGSYTKSDIGHEVYNFREIAGRLYGYFQPSMSSEKIALERIDPAARDRDKLDDVLIAFVASRPDRGQVVVGWYEHAELHRKALAQSPGRPRGYGHLCTADATNCTLLPDWNRTFRVPATGGIGRSNVCYPLELDGSPKRSPWIRQALNFIDDYDGVDIRDKPEMAAELESASAIERAIAQSQGQGFARTAKERKALEDHAMAAAKRYFKDKGFDVEDHHVGRPYDLLFTRNSTQIYVEVKGTTTDGDSIVLTNGEVKHACGVDHACVLFILHSIHLKGDKASGGRPRVLDPWTLEPSRLMPITYTYRLH